MSLGGLGILLTSLIFEGNPALIVTDWSALSVMVASAVIVSNLLFYSLYLYLLRFFSATFMSLSGSLCPFFAALVSLFCFKEPLPPVFWISLGLVMVSTLLFYKDELYLK
jgi:drug/metabolite transporter (DMT)-like permease